MNSIAGRLAILLLPAALVAGCTGTGVRAVPSGEPSPRRSPTQGPTLAETGRRPHHRRPTPSFSPPPVWHASPSPSPTEQPGSTASTSNGVPASLMGTQWYTLPTSQRVVALTFDAGANADAVPSILATLAEKDVPATFFLTGRWVETYPDLAAEIGASYPVGNHSYSHPDLTSLPDAAVRQEIEAARDAIVTRTMHDPRPLFRFPFGAWSEHLIDLVNEEGYGAINWTVDTRGWMGTSGGQSPQSVHDRVLDALQPGEIVIMHVGSNPDDGSTLDADALPGIIDAIRARGYGFILVQDDR